MARISLILLLVGLLAGCQQPQTHHSISIPNLDGPVVLAAPEARPHAATEPLTPPVARAKPAAPEVPAEWRPLVAPNDWKWIVIHHSAGPVGCASTFDRAHRQRGWDELGYHFVIGNGTGSGDGEIEIGSRWPRQKWGAHAKTADNRYNDYGIGICLVGNFELQQPTPAQLRSLLRLTGYLMATYHIPPERIMGHCETKPTDCPGRHVNIADVRRQSAGVAEMFAASEEPARTASRHAASPTAR